MAQPATNPSSAFHAVLGRVPTDTYVDPQTDLAPIVRDLAVGARVLGRPEEEGKKWVVEYDDKFQLCLERVSQPDHNNPNVRIEGYALNVSDAKGFPVLEARVYDHHDAQRGELTHEFRVEAARGGEQAKTLHRSFYQPLKPMFEGQFKALVSPA